MRAVVEKGNKNISERKNRELTRMEPPKHLFKVVVNNYGRQGKEMAEIEEDNDETTDSPQVGLPPQPTKYLKYPEYDWF